MNQSTEQQKLKEKALKALAQREHSRFELEQKLSAVSDNSALIEDILTEYEEKNWLNDARFARLYLQYRAKKYYGPRKISYELDQRGISKALIDEVFKHCELNWDELAEAAQQRKFGCAAATSWIDRGKQKQYLYQRGYILK
jgi:regulatory protein